MSFECALEGLTVDPTTRKLKLNWLDGTASEFHFVWLRHSGRCRGGMPNDTSVKIDMVPDNPSELSITNSEFSNDSLSLHWYDDVKTDHSLSNLKSAAYDAAVRLKRKHRPTLWGNSDADKIPVFDYASLVEDETVFNLQMALCDYGIAFVRQVPTVPDTVVKIAKLLGPVHMNNYGSVFDVKTDNHAKLGSNTGAYLGPHTDESYRHTPPGISMFHCLEAVSEGGESLLVDGFYAAQLLRDQFPDDFKTLCQVPVFFQRKAPPGEDMRTHGRIITIDIDGEVVGVKFTDRTLPPQDVPAEHVEPLYSAIKAYWRAVNDLDAIFQYKMQPGDLHIFDNHRVLHGRTAFDPGMGSRHLQQCSVNRDEFHNTLRVRAATWDPEVVEKVFARGALG